MKVYGKMFTYQMLWRLYYIILLLYYFSCQTGYTLEGIDSAKCMKNGEWSVALLDVNPSKPELPKCQPLLCEMWVMSTYICQTAEIDLLHINANNIGKNRKSI